MTTSDSRMGRGYYYFGACAPSGRERQRSCAIDKSPTPALACHDDRGVFRECRKLREGNRVLAVQPIGNRRESELHIRRTARRTIEIALNADAEQGRAQRGENDGKAVQPFQQRLRQGASEHLTGA